MVYPFSPKSFFLIELKFERLTRYDEIICSKEVYLCTRRKKNLNEIISKTFLAGKKL